MKFKPALYVILVIAMILTACGGESQTAANNQGPANNSNAQNNSQTDNTTNDMAEEEMDTGAEADAPMEYEMAIVKMNGSTLTSFTPLYIAEAEGYFEEFGIQIEFVTFNRTTEAVPFIINGDIDVYAGSANTGLLNVLAQEPNIKVVVDRGHVAPDDPCTYLGMLVRKDLVESGEITTPADLAGRIIAATTSGPTGFLTSAILASAGLTFEDVTLENMPPTAYVDALANGTVDAVVGPETHLTRVLAEGASVLMWADLDFIAPYQSGVLVFGKRLLVDEPDVGARFLAAFLKGVAKYNEGKTNSNIAIMAEKTGLDADLIEKSCWVNMYSDGHIDFSGVDAFQQWSMEQGQLDALVTEDQFWDPSILNAALGLLDQ